MIFDNGVARRYQLLFKQLYSRKALYETRSDQ